MVIVAVVVIEVIVLVAIEPEGGATLQCKVPNTVAVPLLQLQRRGRRFRTVRNVILVIPYGYGLLGYFQRWLSSNQGVV